MITKIKCPEESNAPLNQLTEHEKEQCKLAAIALGCAFDWYESAEGYEFWLSVSNRLYGLAHGKEPLR